MCMKMFWSDIYYDIKWGIWAIRKYTPIVWKMKDYDYHSILKMMKFQLELLCDRIEHRGFEVVEDKMKKVVCMRRSIELIDNQMKDDYAERCGYDYNYKIDFVTSDYKEGYWETTDDKTPEQKENNSIALKSGKTLEKKEWDELWDTIKESGEYGHGMKSWWD